MSERVVPVTVVIPAHNADAWIGRTLGSVLAQTVRPARTIVVDDASSDRTAEIAAAFGASVIRRPSGGVSAARNTGIAAAATPWVALLDHDDVWDSRKLELQWDALAAAPDCRFSFTDVYLFDDGGIMEARSHWVRRNYARVEKRHVGASAYVYPKETFAAAFARDDYVLPSTMLFDRAFVLDAGGFDARLGWLEDREFVNRIVHRTDSAVVEEPLTGYYHHASMGSNDEVRNARHEAIMTAIVVANPAAYLPSTVERYRDDFPRALVRSGKALLANGETDRAAQMFAASFRARPNGEAAAGRLAAAAFRVPGVRPAAYAAYGAVKSAAGSMRAVRRRTREP